MALMKAFGSADQDVDFYAFNGDNEVWDPTALGGDGDYVAWNPADYIQYRIPDNSVRASEGQYSAEVPNTDAVRYEAWFREGTLNPDNLFYEGEIYALTRPGDPVSTDEAINHDTGPTGNYVADNLQFLDANNIGIDDADVRAYLKSDYDIGRVSRPYIKSQTKTGVVDNGIDVQSGRMPTPLYVPAGAVYTITFHKTSTGLTRSAEVDLT